MPIRLEHSDMRRPESPQSKRTFYAIASRKPPIPLLSLRRVDPSGGHLNTMLVIISWNRESPEVFQALVLLGRGLLDMGITSDRERYEAALQRNRDRVAQSKYLNALALHEAWIKFYAGLLKVDLRR